MNKGTTKLLQAVVVLVGASALAFLLWVPHVEGRNAHATLFQIYFEDPFLAYAYLASIPFFVALHQAFKALGFAGRGEGSSPATAKALRTIRLCALATIGSVVLGEVFIVMSESDDRAGGVFMGALVAFGAAVAAAAASKIERKLHGTS
ncbi:MAG: DUF2975 domain-containing protein [Elusimicrobia bacterium]|nr:DUF2975 domain-containing protein [Elusimicrobiota bacterium]